MDALQTLARDMRARSLAHRERKRIGRAVELEQFAARLESEAAAFAFLRKQAPATFAEACHTLADRARIVHDHNPGLLGYELRRLLQLEAYAHDVGDDAETTPDLYTEPQA